MKYAALIFTLLASVWFAAIAAASSDTFYTSFRDNLAVGGYDVVSFYSGKPLEGKAEFATEYKGADWQFASRANLDLFRTNPEAFVPQYGGYCAWAAANGKLAKGSPEYWHIRDGKLYLNYNRRIQERWDRNISGFITQADLNWPALLEK